MRQDKRVFWLGIFVVFLSFLALVVWLISEPSLSVYVGNGNNLLVDERDAFRLPEVYPSQGQVSSNVEDQPVLAISPSVESKHISRVPFTSQAPFAQWDDDIFQGACEESSVIMAMHWVRGTSLDSNKATQEIQALADFQKENYGYFYDTSAKDTFDFFSSYFNYEGAELFYDIGAEDIIQEINEGNIVVVPINGQKLHNPYYVPPGPIAHMLVVVGYDDERKEFITNDPGTRHGEGIRYSYDIFANALQDYPTGYYEPITREQTAMIVVRKNI